MPSYTKDIHLCRKCSESPFSCRGNLQVIVSCRLGCETGCGSNWLNCSRQLRQSVTIRSGSNSRILSIRWRHTSQSVQAYTTSRILFSGSKLSTLFLISPSGLQYEFYNHRTTSNKGMVTTECTLLPVWVMLVSMRRKVRHTSEQRQGRQMDGSKSLINIRPPWARRASRKWQQYSFCLKNPRDVRPPGPSCRRKFGSEWPGCQSDPPAPDVPRHR
jgi:hypothetical protein